MVLCEERSNRVCEIDMTSAQRKIPTVMTLDEFIAWPGDGEGGRYQLVDGELRAMSPASTTHGTIQARLAGLIDRHLEVPGNRCRVMTEPAIAVRVNANMNLRVPDLGVACSPDAAGQVTLPDPTLLIELISPGNRKDTQENVWAYTTIPTVVEILVVETTRIEAGLLRRQSDGSWPHEVARIGPDDLLELASINLTIPLRDLYAKTYLEAT